MNLSSYATSNRSTQSTQDPTLKTRTKATGSNETQENLPERELSIESAPRCSPQFSLFSKLRSLKNQSILLQRPVTSRLFPIKPIFLRPPSKDLSSAISTIAPGQTTDSLKSHNQNQSSAQIASSSASTNTRTATQRLSVADLVPRSRTSQTKDLSEQSSEALSGGRPRPTSKADSKSSILKRRPTIANSLRTYLNFKLESPVFLPIEDFRKLMAAGNKTNESRKSILKTHRIGLPATDASDGWLQTEGFGTNSSATVETRRKVSFSKNRLVKLYCPRSSEHSRDDEP